MKFSKGNYVKQMEKIATDLSLLLPAGVELQSDFEHMNAMRSIAASIVQAHHYGEKSDDQN